MNIRPDLAGMTKAQLDYVESLEKIAKNLEHNGAVDFMAALNNKLKLLAEQINGMDLVIDLKDKDDKTLDRLLKMVDLGQGVISSFKTFIQEYGHQTKEDEKKGQPHFEKIIRNKQAKEKAANSQG